MWSAIDYWLAMLLIDNKLAGLLIVIGHYVTNAVQHNYALRVATPYKVHNQLHRSAQNIAWKQSVL